VEEIDWSVGQILDSLKEQGVDENTLVIYTSDNGPWKLKNGHGGSAAPLRGFKFATWEGGMRVPCIMRWPGRIPADTTCDEMGATIDLLPTLAILAGAQLPADRTIDGKDILPLITGVDGAVTPHDNYFYYRGNSLQCVRSGDWKLRLPGKKKFPQLYNLSMDISETTDVADQHPELVASLRKRIEDFDAELKANVRPVGE